MATKTRKKVVSQNGAEPDPAKKFTAEHDLQEASVIAQVLQRANVPGAVDKVVVGQIQAKWERLLKEHGG